MTLLSTLLVFTEWSKIDGVTCQGASSHHVSFSFSSYECSNAVDGILEADNGEWASQGEGTGAYIEFALPGLYEIKQIRIMQRFYHGGQFKDVQVLFDKYTKQTVDICYCLDTSHLNLSL